MKKLQQWGVTLLILSIGSYVLPLLGMQSPVFSLLRAIPPVATIILTALGALLLIVGIVRKPKGATKPARPSAAPPIVEQQPIPAYHAGSCAACGSPLQPEEVFCGNCGAAQVRPASQPAQPVVSVVSTPGKTNAPLRMTLLALAALLVIAAGFFVIRSGVLSRASGKQSASTSTATAGSLVESPIDNAGKNTSKAAMIETAPPVSAVHPSQPTVGTPVRSSRRSEQLPPATVTVPGVSPGGALPPGIATASRGNSVITAPPGDALSQITVSASPPPSQLPTLPSRPGVTSSAGGMPGSGSATRTIYNGPRFGTLRWSGVVEEGGVITIDGDRASSGTLNGALPGLPIQVELVSKHAAISEAPAPSNGWKRIAIRSSKRQTEIALKWTVLP